MARLNTNPSHDYYEADLTETRSWKNLIELLDKTYSRITLIVNAGVINPIDQLRNIPVDNFTSAINVNLIAPLSLTSELAAYQYRTNSQLRIFNISSGAASRAISGWGAYCTTKCAFRMYLDVLAIEQQNVDVVHFDPGVIDTQMQAIIREKKVEQMPNVGAFITLKNNLVLQHSSDVAIKVLDLLGEKQ